MSWIDQVHAAEDRPPDWLTSVLEDEHFIQLDRVDGWRIVPSEEIEFRGASLKEACRLYSKHYGLKEPP